MKTRTLFILMAMIMTFGWSARADETITVSATNEDISQNLDLRAVASLFGQCANLEEFEQKLNSEETRISNLDLNGDGDVDYLRIVESADGNKHLVLIQAVLAKDIFQDVASIYVEKDPDNQIIVQVVGDEYIYGVNYIIEPAYLYVPVIYDWFWGPHWVCWYSPWYWGYWPGWWHAYHCWAFDRYWYHIHDYHHHHHYCSFRHTQHRAPGYDSMHRGSAAGRHDMALRHPEGSFERRNAGKMDASGRKLSNTRDIQRSRAGQTAVNRRGDNNRTFGSSNTRVARHDQASSAARSQSNSGVRGQSESRSQQASRGQASASRSQASTSRSQASTSRGQASTSRSGSTSTSSSTTKKSSSSARSSASTFTSRSSASTSTSRSSSSSSSRSSGSYGGSSRSGGSSAPSRSGGYGGGGGSRGGGSMGGGSHSGGGSRSGGGGGGHRR